MKRYLSGLLMCSMVLIISSSIYGNGEKAQANIAAVENAIAAYNNLDVEGFLNGYSEDVTVDVAGIMKYTSLEDWRQHQKRDFAAHSDISFKTKHISAAGNLVILEGTWHAKLTGENTMPDGTVVQPTGKSTDLGCVLIYKFENDKIVEVRCYWNSLKAMTDFGLFPPQ